MAQFDVYRLRGEGLVVDCQHDLLRDLPTRIVAPLRQRDASVAERLNPVFSVHETEYAMITQLVGAIDRRDILEVVTSLASDEYRIKGALDFVTSGY